MKKKSLISERLLEKNGEGVGDITLSRLFARFMSQFVLYNPNANKKGGPSIDVAWAHYENVTLARIYADTDKIERAPVGDECKRPTKLYPYWQTSVPNLEAFGTSVRMYFASIVVLSLILLGIGVLNLPMISYFWNYADKEGISSSIRGSAICDDYEWVYCESCNDEYSDYYPSYRLDGTHVMKNTCNMSDWLYPGIFSWCASMILIASLMMFFWMQQKYEVMCDEKIQTSSDYTIKISNPPPNALNPDEWRAFFAPFSKEGVACVTIALNNADLLRALICRRTVMRELKLMLPEGSDMNDQNVIDEATVNNCIKLPFASGAKDKYEELQNLKEKITKLVMEKDYKAVAVFVTFESERGQRNALHALSTGRKNVWHNIPDTSKFHHNRIRFEENTNSTEINFTHPIKTCFSIELAQSSEGKNAEDFILFQGKKVLDVAEAPEPNNVRWMDLETGCKDQWIECTMTLLALIFFISWSGFFIYGLASNGHFQWVALYISITNVAVPKICNAITGFESHATEGQQLQSLYIKITLFRCFNSGIALLLITSFIETISINKDSGEEGQSLVYSVYPVILAELFTIPVTKMCDFMGNFRKHVLAPRAKNQEEMNACMMGGKFDLAERYTDATKVIFVSLLYSSVLPESFFLGAAALAIHFLFGKFCLLRIWRAAPDIRAQLSKLSRNSFLSTSVIVHLIMSAFFWSGYPYDQVCSNDEGGYDFCNQDMLRSHIFPLPRFQENVSWMTSSQEVITSLYGWSSLVAICIGVVFHAKMTIYPSIVSIFRSTYKPDGNVQESDFHQVKDHPEIQAYIPRIQEKGFEFPFIACNINNLDPNLLGRAKDWNHHNLTDDIEEIMNEFPAEKPLFSIFKHWPRE